VPFARCHSAGRVHYAERGERRAASWPFLLIHGAGASSAIWMMVMARLGRASRAVAIDLPGHGPSPGFEDQPQPAIADYCRAAGELAALTELGRSVLIGHSMGALVAMEAALAWPDKVAGLVLCAAAPQLPVSRDLMSVIDQDYAHFPAWLAERVLSASAKPALRRAFVAAGIVAPQAVTRADFHAIAGADLSARVAGIRCPVVWLDGADDAIVAERGERPGVIERLPGVGHLVPLEAPAAVARAAIEMGARPGPPD
jgi:pimeloyl-ACP methyl ester carboxylesterase